jgi:DNA-binding transcriptional LysR family regulator
MQVLDLNLLVTLDALLTEGSVRRAAERMGLSAPAMSHALARLRDALGDPVLVRAGRGLVPTPRALALRARVRQVVEDARTVFQPGEGADLATVERVFTIRTQGAGTILGGRLMTALRAQAPGIRLRFVPDGDEDVNELRDGRVDLDIGAAGPLGPEIRTQTLFQEPYQGAVRAGHVLAKRTVTARRYAAAEHISASRRGRLRGPVDVALEELGLQRAVSMVVPDGVTAAAIAADSDLVATIPASLARWGQRVLGLHPFALPVETPPITIVQSWHPRLDADPAHRWLRACVRAAVGPVPSSRA